MLQRCVATWHLECIHGMLSRNFVLIFTDKGTQPNDVSTVVLEAVAYLMTLTAHVTKSISLPFNLANSQNTHGAVVPMGLSSRTCDNSYNRNGRRLFGRPLRDRCHQSGRFIDISSLIVGPRAEGLKSHVHLCLLTWWLA